MRSAMTALRLGFVLAAAVSLLLGYLGFGQFLRHSQDYGNRPIDLFYYDVQLFVLGADPLQQKGPYPWLLEIARFTAPAATVYALFEAGRLIFAAEVRRLRARRSRDHVIVCGEGSIATTLARRLRASGRRVVLVQRPTTAVSGGWLAVFGDARDPETLRAANVGQATALYACGEVDSAANTAVAFAASRARTVPRQPLPVYVHIGDPRLCLTLQARYLGVEHPPGLRLDFFNIDDVAARKLFADEPLVPIDGRPPTIVVVGATTFSQAVVVEAARSWRGVDPGAIQPLAITVIERHATAMIADLTQRYPFLLEVCRLTAHDADLAEMLVAGRLREAPDRAFICYNDEDRGLSTATLADRFWRGALSIVVRLDQLAAFRERTGLLDSIEARHPDAYDWPFDQSAGSLKIFGVVATACRPELIGDDLVGRLARVIHDRYRRARYLEGDTAHTNPSMVRWEELPERLRQSNREQARDIGRKLSSINCVLVPRVEHDDGDVLTDREIEQLAELEHGRWQRARRADGWSYGERPDIDLKNHPAVLDWQDLPDRMRQRNHDAMRELPAILSDAGFQIVHR